MQTLRADYEPLVPAGEERTLVGTFDSDFKAYIATEEPILAVSRKLDKLERRNSCRGRRKSRAARSVISLPT